MQEDVRTMRKKISNWGGVTLAYFLVLLFLALGEFFWAPCTSFWAFAVALPHLFYALPLPALVFMCWRRRDKLGTALALLSFVGVVLWSGFTLPWVAWGMPVWSDYCQPRVLRESPYADAEAGPGPLPAFLVPATTRFATAPEPRASGALRFVTMNVCRFAMGAPAVKAELEEAQADVILLQEVGESRMDEDFYPGRRSDWNVAYAWQLVVLSRYPIVSCFRYQLTDPEVSRRPVLVAVLDTPRGPITVMDAHWNVIFHPFWLKCAWERGIAKLPGWIDNAERIRENQATTCLNLIDALGGDVLVFGDLNGNNQDPSVRRLLLGRKEAHRDASWGLGLTYGVPVPILRLDHGIFPSTWTIVSAKTLAPGASDHRALQVEAYRH